MLYLFLRVNEVNICCSYLISKLAINNQSSCMVIHISSFMLNYTKYIFIITKTSVASPLKCDNHMFFVNDTKCDLIVQIS